MRGVLFWLVGASLAFLITAGAFLVLANFGTAPTASNPIPRTDPSERGHRGPQLALSFSKERLEGLERRQNEPLTLYLKNSGDENLRNVNLRLTVSSEDTAHPRVRRYRETVADLAPGEDARVDLTVDLSPLPPVESLAVLGHDPEGAREILEARAYAPGARAVVETAVISP